MISFKARLAVLAAERRSSSRASQTQLRTLFRALAQRALSI